MYESSPCQASGDSSSPKFAPPGRGPALKPDPNPDSDEPEWVIPLLRCLYVREDSYWPQPSGDDDCSEGPSPILISHDLVLTGGFAGGLKIGEGADLDLVYFDEYGRAFECHCAWHRPWKLLYFLANGFVRIRLFSDLYWRPVDWSPLRNANFHGHAVLAVTDVTGARHHFTFQVTSAIRDLFPSFLAVVT